MLKLFVIGISFAAGVCRAASAADTAPPKPNDYADGKTWLCRPGRQDACAIDHTTTVVAADGKLTRETWTADPNAPIDCFYVYPTISTDPTPNSDMNADPAELNVIKQQFARFASKCRPYAPLYRQVTLVGLRRMLAPGAAVTLDQGLQYDDVKDAWNYYLKNDNKGRGVVLVAHSQGSFILNRLIHDEIDGKPIQSKLVSAILLGTTIAVPKGKDVGGSFQHVPLCHAATQTGCVITFASFRSTIPPPANTLFGKRPRREHGGGVHESGGARRRQRRAARVSRQDRPHDHQQRAGEAVGDAGAADRHAVGERARPADGEVRVERERERLSRGHGPRRPGRSARRRHRRRHRRGRRTSLANWGLHLIDVNLVMGNLLDIVAQQTKVYQRRGKS